MATCDAVRFPKIDPRSYIVQSHRLATYKDLAGEITGMVSSDPEEVGWLWTRRSYNCGRG